MIWFTSGTSSTTPVGNRLEQTIEEGSGPSTVVSSYDERDRLLTVAGTGHGWDSNGNLQTRDATTYGWDLENRLTSVTRADGTFLETTYVSDGNRVRTTLTAPSGTVTTVDYLVDTAGFLSHVVAEVASGSTQTIYTRAGDQLVGLTRPGSGTSRYYHADGPVEHETSAPSRAWRRILGFVQRFQVSSS